jgi:hypothetical protein
MPDFGYARATGEGNAAPSSGAVDLRPILPRGPDNAWQQCEAIRSELFGLMEQSCTRRSVDALVLESEPFQHPVWVKFESWMPCEGPALTARASMTVTIVPAPYHRFETTYSVKWEKHGQSNEIGHLHRFGARQIERMLDLLVAPPAGGLTGRRVRSILRPGQLRLHAWQLWKPKNKVVAIRRDYLKIAAWLLVLAGFGLFFVDRSMIEGVFRQFAPPAESSVTRNQPALPPASAPPSRTAPATPPPQQPPPGHDAATIAGYLGKTNNRLEDGRFFDLYNYEKAAGTQVRISMHSTEFDAFLIAGVAGDGGFQTLASNDDEGAGSTDAAIVLGPEVGGKILIRATSAAAGEKGAYTLGVEQQ